MIESLIDKAKHLDQADPLSGIRRQFVLNDGEVYLDGNSLGALPKLVRDRLAQTIDHEWGHRQIRSWNESWIDVNFEDVSIDLMEHLAGAEVCKEKTNGEISSDPYFLYDNTLVSKEDNGQKWIPALTVSSDPRYNLIQKCLDYQDLEHKTHKF